MGAPYAEFRFPGVEHVIAGTMSIGHGETPAVCILSIAEQVSLDNTIGTLTIEFDSQTYEWPECRAVAASIRKNSQGRIVSLTIEDWRWKWRTGTISGRYNRREPSSRTLNSARQIVKHTEKTPRELFKLYFEALGETNFDVSQVPDDARPEVDHDGESAAQAMASLCDLLGCRVVPAPGNKAIICKAGEGSPLFQSSELIEFNDALDPPERPDGAQVTGGAMEFQVDIELEPMADETSGESVELDKASYKPAGGWTFDDKDEFHNITDLKARNLARQSVYRKWRPKIPAGGLELPGYSQITGKKITRLDQLVLLDRQVETQVQQGRETYLPAWVYGAYEGDNTIGDNAYANTIDEPEPITDRNSDLAKKCILHDSASYDQDKGILTIGRALTLQDAAGKMQPAKLRYRCAVNVRDETTDALFRYTRLRTYGTKDGTKPYEIRREEITARTVPTYDKSFTAVSVDYIRLDADTEADYYLDLKEREWRDLAPSEGTYAGIIALCLDGAIQHIVYSAGDGQPPMTRISRNDENRNYITPYKERRQREALKGAALLAGGVQTLLAAARRLEAKI